MLQVVRSGSSPRAEYRENQVSSISPKHCQEPAHGAVGVASLGFPTDPIRGSEDELLALIVITLVGGENCVGTW